MANIRYKSQYAKQDDLKGAKILIVKCFRRRVWETRHSGATG